MENLKKHFILKVKRLTLFGVIFVYFVIVVFEKKIKWEIFLILQICIDKIGI